MEYLEELPSFRIQHRPGKLNAASDALSRGEQDIPVDADDQRLKDRELQLLKEDETFIPTVQPTPLTLAQYLTGKKHIKWAAKLVTHVAAVKMENNKVF